MNDPRDKMIEMAQAVLTKMFADKIAGKDNWGLQKCLFQGKPAVAIIHHKNVDEETVSVCPFFLFLYPYDLQSQVSPDNKDVITREGTNGLEDILFGDPNIAMKPKFDA